MNRKILSILAVCLVLLSVVAYWLMTRDGMDMDMDMAGMAAPAAVDSNSRKPLYWVAPMDANYRRDVPGLSPMGMPLIPVYESSDTITVSPAIQQNLGLRTDVVVREDFAPNIEAVGYTHWDQSSIHKLHARAEGWLEVFNLASEGDSVLAGDVLYELFSPALVSAQREYLSARASNNASLGAVARERLMSLGFTGEQVATLEQTTRISNRLSRSHTDRRARGKLRDSWHSNSDPSIARYGVGRGRGLRVSLDVGASGTASPDQLHRFSWGTLAVHGRLYLPESERGHA